LWPGGPLRQTIYIVKEAYSDLLLDAVYNEQKRNDFQTNEAELAGIQGVWKRFDESQAVYTFNGNNFVLTAAGRDPVSGTIKVNDNILMLITDNELFGLFVYEFQEDDRLFLHLLWQHWQAFSREFVADG